MRDAGRKTSLFGKNVRKKSNNGRVSDIISSNIHLGIGARPTSKTHRSETASSSYRVKLKLYIF
jgi:hypothetical protein